MTSPLSTDDWAVDPVVAQAAFDAAWDLRTAWHRGQCVTAAQVAEERGAVDRPLRLLHALAVAEWKARGESGEPILPFNEVLQSVVTDPFQLLAALRWPFPQNTESGTDYLYLTNRPPTPCAGYLGQFGPRYRVVRERGRGATGVVFEVVKDLLHGAQKRALKVLELRGTQAEQERARARFAREAKAACSINHPNVARAYDAAEENEIPWIEMDYVYGPNLDELVEHHKPRPVPLTLALDLVRQTALGLAAAHTLQAPVVHRDVKPANVLLMRVPRAAAYPHGWRVCVCDFGFARAANDLQVTQPTHTLGTIAYMSPEQFQGSAVAASSDVFSLGIVAYELLTGTHPFWLDQDEHQQVIASRIRSGSMEDPRQIHASIPDPVAAFVLKMLSLDHAQRPTASVVAETFSGFLLSNITGSAVGEHAQERPDAHTRPALDRGGLVAQPSPVAGAGAPTEPTLNTPIRLQLEVEVWKGMPVGAARPIRDPDVLPLQDGDHFRLKVTTHRPCYIYVFQLVADGDIAPLHPWDGDWGHTVQDEPSLILTVPVNTNDACPLNPGPTGMEAFVALARECPLSPAEQDRLRALFRGPKLNTDVRYRGVDVIDPNEPVRAVETIRGKANLKAARAIEDPVAWLRRVLASAEVRALSSAQIGVCYPFLGT